MTSFVAFFDTVLSERIDFYLFFWNSFIFVRFSWQWFKKANVNRICGYRFYISLKFPMNKLFENHFYSILNLSYWFQLQTKSRILFEQQYLCRYPRTKSDLNSNRKLFVLHQTFNEKNLLCSVKIWKIDFWGKMLVRFGFVEIELDWWIVFWKIQWYKKVTVNDFIGDPKYEWLAIQLFKNYA